MRVGSCSRCCSRVVLFEYCSTRIRKSISYNTRSNTRFYVNCALIVRAEDPLTGVSFQVRPNAASASEKVKALLAVRTFFVSSCT